MAVKIFICYAREDELLLNKLKTHLKPLEREGNVELWHDRDINAGSEWEQEIVNHLNEAQIILLLVSPDFMASDYCYSKEMQRAMERHGRKEAQVIPVILRPVYWQEALFGKLQALPRDGKPVTSLPDVDEAFFNVTEGIRKSIDEMSKRRLQDSPARPTQATILPSQNSQPKKHPVKKFKTLSKLMQIAYIGVAGVIIAAIIGVGVFLWRSSASNQSPPTSTISHTSTPIETATATPTPCHVRCVLYHADWSKGLVGWKGGSQWSVNSEGILVSNGNDQNIKFLIAPYQPKTANYAVEAQIQFLKPFISSADPTLFGVRLRGGEYADVDGYDFYIYKDTARIRVALDPDAQVLEIKPYHLDTRWHTYRIEANNTILTCYIDNVQVLQVSDYNHTQPGLVGLFDINSQINVRNFTVFSL